ncbi:triacylglycerol lipase [Ancylostoma caninum]|uniref:Triacylglycerol lipase n=1 Tax=Ancylostoma caninum TaxID=29170 RepID=A0A368FYQ0_ANCCA|nr:triacylglycerol lipase [Ancylostoma caninum]
MARRDIGPDGSFGGGDHQPGTRTSLATSCSHRTRNHEHRWKICAYASAPAECTVLLNGWKESEIYATTYGDGGKTAAPMVDMKCDYVKQVRWLIQAVAEFTRRRVDVIGYSMGSPIARKAILGGRCVDTGERLGPSLTALVDTFVSVAGANHGSFLCILPFPGACNMVNGLSCRSSFIQNINGRQRYEGLHVFSIYSPQDDKVGFRNACGELTSAIAGSDQEFQVSSTLSVDLELHQR